MGDMSLTFTHRFEAGTPTAPTLHLLHGTGGDENDLLGVGRSVGPKANLLSPRGKVLENGAPRFFRRFAEGIFDEEDIKHRARELSEFVIEAAGHYRFDPKRVIALGYSNGANIAGAMLMIHPDVLAGAILLRPMVPLVPDQTPRLNDKPILIEAGTMDPMGSVSEIERLVQIFGKGGAELTIKQHHGGHGMTHDDLTEAQKWLAENFPETQ
jgi:phospholipase/carboxylesterase/glyoxalase family protein